MRYGYRAGQSAFRFARARNANLCSWASDFNAAYGARRGLASMGSFASAFAAVPQVMGEAPSLASKGFSEQVQKMSGIANAAENSPSDADEEEGEIDLSSVSTHIFQALGLSWPATQCPGVLHSASVCCMINMTRETLPLRHAADDRSPFFGPELL